MTAVANSIITVLLGWVRGIASSLWAFFTGSGSSTLSWLSENWKLLALTLLIICVAIDLTVYVLRWRPARVWSSFFRHIFHRKSHRNTQTKTRSGGTTDTKVQRWVYADGSVREELMQEEHPSSDIHTLPQEDLNDPSPSSSETSAPAVRRRRSQHTAASVELEQSGSTDSTPDIYSDSIPSDTDTTHRRRSRSSQTPSRLRRLLVDETADTSFRYTAEAPAGSRDEKYHEPYYPPQYRRPDSEESSNE